ncbi:hypothetical protein SPRG_00213 [Saprolegnia parasitica CBS 223.65]|uniref:Uncharacterized protein n=1 Tax=Saprolegnia parasitica (strain CBS 223.65) TaxID=695850 RepID=A0A067CXD5_SAPPC|nr:hypothetical protein SPRG_00213 [Saprolegnia parasitica CBS 223.65]KDO35364.1 hypothetical protein SPRG_00213 [Saprolegnia parasitica CBS 223.65]|eukprot:XP_012193710.1 hypothetical protein SPRG_00213 [Saprolegnia parasitica CBS 223.65]
MSNTKRSKTSGTVEDDDDVVVFNAAAYSVVASWIKPTKDDDEADARLLNKKPLYTGAPSMTDEDKLLASKIFKKKRPEPVAVAKADENDENEDDDDLQRGRGGPTKKQRFVSPQEQLLQSLREQQEKRRLKNKKKHKTKHST